MVSTAEIPEAIGRLYVEAQAASCKIRYSSFFATNMSYVWRLQKLKANGIFVLL